MVDNEMVQHFDAEQSSRRDELAGDHDIFRRWGRIARRVVVHDERSCGWGREDREFWNRLSRATTIMQLPGSLLHLDHPRPAMNDAAAAGALPSAQLWWVSDDEMLPHYLERIAAPFAAHPNAKLVRCGTILRDGRTIHSYATPQNVLRRDVAAPTWSNSGPGQDRRYFAGLIEQHGWSETNGDIVVIREALCRAYCDARGGLREGAF